MKRLEPYDTSLNGTSWEQAWEGLTTSCTDAGANRPLW